MTKIKSLRATAPVLENIFLSEAFFENVKNLFPVFSKKGYYQKDDKPCIYIYRQKNKSKTYTGLTVLTHIDEYLNGKMLKHENTLTAKEDRQMKLLEERGGLIKPILAFHPKLKVIKNPINQFIKANDPWFEVDFRGVKNIFWRVEEPKLIKQFVDLYDQHIDKTYIADGHHRAKTIANYYELQKAKNKHHTGEEDYNYIFSTFIAIEDLDILDFNRVVNELGDISPLSLLAKLSNVCDIEPQSEPFKPTKKGEIGMILDNEWFKLTWRKQIKDNYKKKPLNERLDVSILDEQILTNVIGIGKVRESAAVEYVEGTKGLDGVTSKVKKNKGVGFVLYPVQFEDLIKIAEDDMIMPPKSTYFVPRLFNGLLSHIMIDHQ